MADSAFDRKRRSEVDYVRTLMVVEPRACLHLESVCMAKSSAQGILKVRDHWVSAHLMGIGKRSVKVSKGQ